jgi:hypothetical protein
MVSVTLDTNGHNVIADQLLKDERVSAAMQGYLPKRYIGPESFSAESFLAL